MSLEAALICAALTLHHEARGESYLGQMAVVHTLRNRARYNPDRVCGEAFRHRQFSWTINMQGHSAAEFEKALHIASLAWQSQDVTLDATHYHVRPGCPNGIRPYWIAKMHKTVQIGCHIFYRSKT